MNLRHLTDRTLLADTRILVSKEREMTTKILHHLKEIDRRKLYADLGYSSMFEYCVKDLGYSDSGAVRRIKSARMLADLPEIQEKLETGLTNLTNLGLVDKFFKDNNISSSEVKLDIIEKIENKTKSETEKTLFALSENKDPEPRDKRQRISENKIRYSITFKDETADALEKVKDLLQKKMEMDELICFTANTTIEVLKKKKFHLNNTKDSQPPVVVTRVISAAVKRKVFLRDKKCTKCGSTHRLQFDHRIPFALGGKSDEKNVRLLCFNCNQRARIKAGLIKKAP